MFFRPRIFPMLFVGFFALMLFGGIRQSSYRNAYFDGYRAGQIAADQAAPPATDGPAVEAAPSTNQSPYGTPGYGYGHSHRHGIGFFGFLFYLIFFSFIFKTIGRIAWGKRHHWGGYGRSGRYGSRDGRSAEEHDADDDRFNGFGPTYEM